jgi:ABC-type multidrug transport system ATPase subunit
MGKQMAMCPQYNSIFGKLTVDESLNFIAAIKGMNEQDRESNKKFIIETLELQDFKDVRAENLSGGDKRKLSCA